MDKRAFYPTPEEIAYVVKQHPHRCVAELVRILGVDRKFLQGIIYEKGLKVPNHQGRKCK